MSELIIISHRGFWKIQSEKNSLDAFERSLSFGFGIEVDIRDHNGEIVISHDLPNNESPNLTSLLEIYSKFPENHLIAFNIKSDGLQKRLKSQIDFFKIHNYFIFDSSVPDAIQYIKSGMITFTRQSEYEPNPSFYELANGVWIDEFISSWIDRGAIDIHCKNKKKICIVSPELHGRDHKPIWKKYKNLLLSGDSNISKIILCTDYPADARKYFE